MIDKFLTKLFGSSNQRYIKSLMPTVARVNELEESVKKFSDEEMRGRTAELKTLLAEAVKDAADAEDRKRREREALEEILPEAFALVREASVRSTGMRHFDVQIIGGVALHQ
ncbi:MAG: preprotein translocase subunit SecA, partial [Pyrinomonadaceae bacterium]